MKKRPILILGFIFSAFLQAQNIEESTYTEKNKVMESLSFSIPVCNKDVLINTWKTFIKKQGGKVKGGIVNKVNGSDIKFSSSGKNWNGYFVYGYNEDKTMNIFTSFQNIQGTFINSENSEKEAAISILEDFRLSIQKSCILDDLTKAKNYGISLSKEKIRNSDKILYLEKSLRNDQQKIDLNTNQDLSEKEQLNLNKIKQRVISNEKELQTLKDRNDAIDEELKAQSTVIQNFQNQMDTLDGKIIPEETRVDFDNSSNSDINDN